MRITTIPALTLLVFFALFSGCEKQPLPPTLPPPTAEAIAAFAEAAYSGNAPQVAVALKNGMPVNQVEENGNSGLMLAAFNGHTDAMRVLLDAGADINLRDTNERTALMFAASGPFPEAVKLLIEKGADINAIDKDEHFTALMFAAGEGLSPVVDLLLAHGADPKLKDKDNDTAASFARKRDFIALADQLQALIDTP
jgi:ankyrin repeat protein